MFPNSKNDQLDVHVTLSIATDYCYCKIHFVMMAQHDVLSVFMMSKSLTLEILMTSEPCVFRKLGDSLR